MVVTNTGGADAMAVLPAQLSIVGAGGAIINGSYPAAQGIPAGLSQVFAYACITQAGTGSLVFHGGSPGTDQYSGMPVAPGNGQQPDQYQQACAARYRHRAALSRARRSAQEVTFSRYFYHHKYRRYRSE